MRVPRAVTGQVMIQAEKSANATKDGSMPAAKILVVEDDSYLRASIKDILEIEHYTVITAHDGREGLEKLNEDPGAPPALIVSDIMMPYMDGFEFLDAVRKERQWVSIPFIFLTAKSEKVDMYRGKDLGADDYLHKPFDAEDLLNAVKARLKRHAELEKVQTEIREGQLTDHKKGMLAMIGHEFRTPLTLVVAYNEMLKEFESGQVSDMDMLTFLKGVNDGASRLRRLVENFMLLVELESGDAAKNYSWRKRKIDNPETIFALAQQQIFNSTVEHHCNLVIDEELPPLVADFDLVVIAVRELLHNAVKFSSPDKPVILGAQADDSELCIWVEDGGIGIPEHEYANIWKTFYQIDREKRETQGSGSGLAIVRGIVNIHAGRTEVISKMGEGSRLSLYIPLQPLQ
jgi:DNA-binding response OmpR family regulator/anti-sigma regulatory factor (Ser/Thr protein kinase)